MKNRQSGFTPIAIIVIVLIVGLVTLVALSKLSPAHRNKPTSTASAASGKPQPNNYPYLTQDSLTALGSIDTSNWPTFTKQDAWFTFSYPSNWVLDNDLGAYKAKPDGKLFDQYILRLTSPDGNHTVGYDAKVQTKGSQIQINVTYSANGITHPVADCHKDLPYRLVTQSTGADGDVRCLVDYGSSNEGYTSSGNYGVIFDSHDSQVTINLFLGSTNSTSSDKEAIQILTAIAHNIQIQKIPS